MTDKTLKALLEQTAKQFAASELYYGHGTDNAWDEAVALILPSLDLPIDADESFLYYPVNEEQQTDIAKLVDKRITQHIPIAYLTKQAWFCGLAFYVDERVLIPRSPIAELIEQQFAPWLPKRKHHQILDMCTGGGCIAIASALAIPHSTVDAADISFDALAVAKLNIAKYKLASRVKLYQGDLFSNIPAKKYDLIVSNPPYVDQQDMQALPAEYKHEPQLGLAAGHDGLICVDKILRQAADYLADDGILIVEVGNSEEALVKRYPKVPFVWLEFVEGGHGVFLLTAEHVRAHYAR